MTMSKVNASTPGSRLAAGLQITVAGLRAGAAFAIPLPPASYTAAMPAQVFAAEAQAAFAAAYPCAPTRLTHQLAGHPLLELAALAALARRMRPESCEHNAAVGL